MIETTVKIDGMMCSMCESHVNDAVRKACKVKKVTSSHVKGRTTVVADDNTDVNAIVNAIAAQGYKVSDVETKPYEKRGLFGIFKK